MQLQYAASTGYQQCQLVSYSSKYKSDGNPCVLAVIT